MMLNKIKTTKAYYEGYKIVVNGCQHFLAEFNHGIKAWDLFQLDEDGDIYGYKEWVNSFDRLKDAKSDLIIGAVEYHAF